MTARKRCQQVRLILEIVLRDAPVGGILLRVHASSNVVRCDDGSDSQRHGSQYNSQNNSDSDEAMMQRWHADMVGRLGITPQHAARQVRVLKIMLRDFGKRFAAIKPSDIVEWVSVQLRGRGDGARRTLANRGSTLRTYGSFLVSMGVSVSNPASSIRMPIQRAKRRLAYKPFNQSEIEAIIKAAQAREQLLVRARRAMPSVFYELLYQTGLRYGELCKQRVEDIDMVRGVMTVTCDKARRCDIVPLSDRAVTLMAGWLRSPHREHAVRLSKRAGSATRLFPMAPSHHTLVQDMLAAGVIQEASERERGQWHRFRKSALSHRARAGASVADLHQFARHESAQTTLQLYDFAKPEELRPVAELLRMRAAATPIPPAEKKSLKKRVDKGEDARNTVTSGSRASRIVQPKDKRGTPCQANAVRKVEPGGIEPQAPEIDGTHHVGLFEAILEAHRLTLGAIRDAGSSGNGDCGQSECR
jgi:site-specific recombinase XerD